MGLRELRTFGRYREFFMPDDVNPSWRHSQDQPDWDAKNADVVQLEQVPHPQGALFMADHRTGYVTAMVGGYDYARSELNSAVQSCRQPGSTYKPIYYSAAIDDGCVSRHASDCLRVMLLRIFRTHGGRHERADTGTDYEFGKELTKRVGIRCPDIGICLVLDRPDRMGGLRIRPARREAPPE